MAPQYNKGEYIIYGTNGICYIDSIKSMDFSNNSSRDYYVLKPKNNVKSTLYVPIDNELLTSRIRYILTKEDIDSLLLKIKEQNIEWIEDKNLRAKYFKEVLSSNDESQLLLAIRCLYTRKSYLLNLGKKLPNTDETILQFAEKMVREEFSYSLEILEDDVENYIKSILEVA